MAAASKTVASNHDDELPRAALAGVDFLEFPNTLFKALDDHSKSGKPGKDMLVLSSQLATYISGLAKVSELEHEVRANKTPPLGWKDNRRRRAPSVEHNHVEDLVAQLEWKLEGRRVFIRMRMLDPR